ncbi:amino-acid N-acetyltransferas-like protein subunit Mak10 [Ophiobolus disseminans]|uniref:Amino-acid N-acetyltransferas-like protein subunit Mak10 n=1 Tax=Ophiobolus disseminans TaxID=1469910 RepID=A0A6A6ZZC8_9PLEO|nr:amino-acid N-acetyltransferas-like protein subunit Mak10 [Ophiobolus disseminans]
MADPLIDHNTASDPVLNNVAPYVAPISSHVHASGSNAQATTSADLPLRQSLRRSQSAYEPRVHDITEKFTRASNALDVGQLVKDDYFTLFESIGAIEIMDSKMDSGFLNPGETLEDDYDTLTPLLPEEIIGIMDQLLCYEMAWHTGYPLSQTLFTSVYIDKLLWPEVKILEQAQFYRGTIPDEKRPGPLLQALRAYCLALIKGCDFVIAKITSRDYFEEEDFCTHIYNRVLFMEIPMDVFLRELDAAMEVMKDTDLQINDALRSSIISRLALRKDLLRALDIDLPLEHISYSWPPIHTGIQKLKATHQLGQTVPGSFSTKMQRRLASTVPPRPIVELEFVDALEKLQYLATDCEEATRFVKLPQDPLEYQSFLWSFASRSPAPLSYARSYLATLLFHPGVLESAISLPLLDVKALVFPASSPVLDPSNWTYSPPRNALLSKPPRLEYAMLIDDFADRCGQPYMDLWIALGQNRCRLRRMLTHVIAGWDILQSDASLADETIASASAALGVAEQVFENPLSSWAYHKKLWMLEKILLLGFELDVYLPDEFAGQYLFLSLIATRRRDLLFKIEAHYNKYLSSLVQARNFPDAQDVEDALPYISSLVLNATGTAALSLALARFYIVLLYLRLVPVPARPFSSEQLRYEVRMKPFLGFQPPEVPPFEDFAEHVKPYGAYTSPNPGFDADIGNSESEIWTAIEDALKSAKEAFARVKKLGAQAARAEGVKGVWGKDVQARLASCVAAGVAVAGVKDAVLKRGEEGLGVRVEIPESGEGKRYAEGWVVGRVVKE